MLPGQQALAAGVGDHGAIVRAEPWPRIKDLPFHLGQHGVQRLAQRAVGTDPAGDHQRLQAGLLQRTAALDCERFDHRLLECKGDVAAGLLAVVTGRPTLLECIEGKGLQAAEAEIEPWPIGHRPRKHETPRHAVLGQPGDFRPAGIRQAHQLGGLVEGLAGSIIHRLTEQLVATDAIDAHQLGMPAGNQQCDERKRRRLLLEHRCQQMPFHMMHTNRRYAPGERQRLRAGGPDQQRADQSWAGGIGDRIDLRSITLGIGKHLANQRQHALDVIARGELGHYAAIDAMQVDLAE